MRTPDDPESREAHRIQDILDELSRFGNHVGVTLALTPVGESPANLIAMLEKVRQGPIAVDFDPALHDVTCPLLVLVRHLDRSPDGQLRIHVQRRREHVDR